jgi:hypothetical protein
MLDHRDYNDPPIAPFVNPEIPLRISSIHDYLLKEG